ncbi:UDP-N-acetylmuramoyl-tripeptide--D-alanyl-D-alanine ligase [Helicobacter saguini]|uniref:UDP-N-acetylmuramoyl-tripeptide--D-alanyl-D-alanine ligase n=1 Tax=Helicobacter saguini TaxID=1548018 RepID=A0A347VMW2_9HELI|nr:UDP-N-acetylmuramoyl-tripeptide--D-alanyl-D-alanine ligase [Helicobacter saguini]MWV61999.1 UDP-N-acetylmuramoyl-tripeptide--D-alanyl-D-alanine ligase [Helicobacter saguini]MWV67327.1 UDP-N-acetylmuramoyl-tripeptide--D-alanyl-D-alanine ligase [Helicobacter saguini]MWV69679.1 UDP-N-acetylmuramoyl-tripeptide--D-alanyl-D-alanine ligase [Helicobacter saguini]MWV73104.1 UDP-N-acetylmuramoyl-tripeptide--D-alanyl-D-alanine ligase [Helicobacter saguini]TLD95527.1 UDP-N-acetylmuramoyl-tripeptide--D-
MQTLQIILNIFNFAVLALLLAYYLITNLQWYNYSLGRVLFKHHKQKWHFFYFLLPIIVTLLLLVTLPIKYSAIAVSIGLCAIYIPAFILWIKGLDKKLVFTGRVKRYFLLIIIFISLSSLSYYFYNDLDSKVSLVLCFFLYIFSIFLSVFLSHIIESILFQGYKNRAKRKIESLENLVIIAITGSFGKTSMKNFVAEILSEKYRVYRTQKSVNTLKGLVADINANVSGNIDIYVAEAGARARGDIDSIARLLNPQYAVIGKVGSAHIEYFKTKENTLKTKLELLDSKRLIKAFMHKDNEIKKDYISQDFRENISKIITYPPPDSIKNIESTLSFTKFSMLLDSKWVDFETKILGRFNVDNIAVAALLGFYLGLDSKSLQRAVASLKPVEHRLQRIDAGGKIILDDSFNGNLDGMLEALRLASLHNGRKVIITPGLIECDEASNIALAKRINEVFDLAIITGSLNAALLDSKISKPQKIIMKDKGEMQEILAAHLKSGDLVLFANDAPSFI